MSFNRVYAWLHGVVRSGDFKPVHLDDSTESLNSIDYTHHEIHAGCTFRVSTTATALADNGTQQFVLTVGAKEAHLHVDATCGGDAVVEIYEAPTGVSGTTAITPINKNRTSAKVSGVTVIADPDAVTGLGTRLAGDVLGGGTKKSATGGDSSSRSEIVLKPLTAYLIRLTNLGGAAKIASIEAEWYEHTPKN